MIVTIFEGKPEIGTEEGGTKLSHEFFTGICSSTYSQVQANSGTQAIAELKSLERSQQQMEFRLEDRWGIYILQRSAHDLPQTRHKEFQSGSENGGFLRITAGRKFVAKTAMKDRHFSIISSK